MNDKSQDMRRPANLEDLKLSEEQLDKVNGGAITEEDVPVDLPPCSNCGGQVRIYRWFTHHTVQVVCNDCDYLQIIQI